MSSRGVLDNLTPKEICKFGCSVLKVALKVLIRTPMFKDFQGRLTVLLQVLFQIVCFSLVVSQLSADAAWWRRTALSDSYKVCRAVDPSVEMLQLCKAFKTDLQTLLDVFAAGVSVECLKLCTAVGALSCSRQMATSTRLDRGSWFAKEQTRAAVGRFRQTKAGRLSFSKPCQWRAAALACGIWGLCLLCDLTVIGMVAWYGIGFKSQITEYSDELFPEAMDEHTWGSVFLTVAALGAVIVLETCMLAAAGFKLKTLGDISNSWDYTELASDPAKSQPSAKDNGTIDMIKL